MLQREKEEGTDGGREGRKEREGGKREGGKREEGREEGVGGRKGREINKEGGRRGGKEGKREERKVCQSHIVPLSSSSGS